MYFHLTFLSGAKFLEEAILPWLSGQPNVQYCFRFKKRFLLLIILGLKKTLNFFTMIKKFIFKFILTLNS